MKALIFIVVIAAAVFLMVRAMKKSQAKADLARREAIGRRKKQTKEAVTPEEVMIWPVIVRPAKNAGSDSDGSEEEAVEEPSMTTIEYKHPGQIAS